MTISWTITDSAAWDYTLTSSYANIPGAATSGSYSENSGGATQTITSFGSNSVVVSTLSTATATGTYSTSTTATEQVYKRTTTTFFETEGEEPYYQETTSASYNAEASSIETYTLASTATITSQVTDAATVLALTSAGTYIRPLKFEQHVPTVYAWSSTPGWTAPTVSDASAASMAFSGMVTKHPQSGQTTVGLIYESFGPAPSSVTETWQSTTLTWTKTTTTSVESTGVSSPAFYSLTQPTETLSRSIVSTQTTSSVFSNIHTYETATAPVSPVAQRSLWWASTVLEPRTFAFSNTTVSGSSSTTSLTSSWEKLLPFYRMENEGLPSASGQEGAITAGVVAFFGAPISSAKTLAHGRVTAFNTAYAGFALGSSFNGAAGLSANQSFERPPLRFSTVSIQEGVGIPLPFQSRSASSSNSTTLWSLGLVSLSMTTRATDSNSTSSTTQTYELKTASPTIWQGTYSSVSESKSYFAAGGDYPEESFAHVGGLVSATVGTSQYTSNGSVSVGASVTAFAPLPHFRDTASVIVPVATSAVFANSRLVANLPILDAPLTA